MKRFKVRPSGEDSFTLEADKFHQTGEYVSFYQGAVCTALVRLCPGGFVIELTKSN